MKVTAICEVAKLYFGILIVLLAAAGLIASVGLQMRWLVPTTHIQEIRQQSLQEDSAPEGHQYIGPVTLISQLIPVDPSVTYDISMEIRAFAPKVNRIAAEDGESTALSDADGLPAAPTFLGVETYDKNLNYLRSRRYAGASNAIIRPINGWVTLAGSLHGEGSKRNDQFYPGTRFIRVIALLNYNAPEMRSEIRNLTFSPRIDLNRRR